MAERAHHRRFSWEPGDLACSCASRRTLTFEDVLAPLELVSGLLIPATGTNVMPQLLAPGGAARGSTARRHAHSQAGRQLFSET
jgi:hypothetical protein